MLAGFGKKPNNTLGDDDPKMIEEEGQVLELLELKAENAQLVCRLAEMERALQQAQHIIVTQQLVDESHVDDGDLREGNLSRGKESEGSEVLQPKPRAIYGSLLIPAGLGSGSFLAGSEGDVPIKISSAPQWMFKPPPLKSNWAIRIRSSPDRSSAKTEYSLRPFAVFSVSEEVQSSDGTLYLKLSDGRGWVFDRVPEVGTMCVRLSFADEDCARSSTENGSEEVATSAFES